jgi:hypothetical protein
VGFVSSEGTESSKKIISFVKLLLEVWDTIFYQVKRKTKQITVILTELFED